MNAHLELCNIMTMSFIIGISISDGMSYPIGKYIGSGDYKTAKKFSIISI